MFARGIYAGRFYDGGGRGATGSYIELISESGEVGAQPFWIWIFYTVNAIAGIGVSLWLAKRSDSQGDRRKLIIFCCLMAIGNALLFAFNRHYLTLITCGVLLASLANTAMPQLFALAREYADNRREKW